MTARSDPAHRRPPSPPWRAPDSYGYNEVFMAVAAVVILHLEAALRRQLGVWLVPQG